MNPEVTGSRPVSSDAEQQWIVRRARLHPHFLGSGGARSVKRSPHGFRRIPAFRPERLSSPPLHPVPQGTGPPFLNLFFLFGHKAPVTPKSGIPIALFCGSQPPSRSITSGRRHGTTPLSFLDQCHSMRLTDAIVVRVANVGLKSVCFHIDSRCLVSVDSTII